MISIIIPLFNKEKYILETLKSITQQTFKDFEIIVVDDCSTDNSLKIAEEFLNTQEFTFKIISTKEESKLEGHPQISRGPGKARNIGLKLAKFNLVTFMDADDEMLPNFLEKMYEIITTNEVAAASTAVCYDTKENSTNALWLKRGIKEGIYDANSEKNYLRFVHAIAFMFPGSTLFKKHIVEKYAGFYDIGKCLYAEDSYLLLQILLNNKIYFDFNNLYIYNRRASTLANRKITKREIEPFLLHPENIYKVCPESNKKLLDYFLKYRAYKTAFLMNLSGETEKANFLLHSQKFRFLDLFNKFFILAQVSRIKLFRVLMEKVL